MNYVDEHQKHQDDVKNTATNLASNMDPLEHIFMTPHAKYQHLPNNFSIKISSSKFSIKLIFQLQWWTTISTPQPFSIFLCMAHDLSPSCPPPNSTHHIDSMNNLTWCLYHNTYNFSCIMCDF